MLFPGDLHFDKQDTAACHLMLQVAEYCGVNAATLVGDTFESAGISAHKRMRAGRHFRFGAGTIKAEGKAARPILDGIKHLVMKNRGTPGGLHVLTGNHEHWWDGVQDEYPGLVDTPWFELYGDLFDDWHMHAEYTALKYGPLLVAHGHRLRGSLSRTSASSVLSAYPGQNTLYGHTHRVDSCITPTYKYGKQVRHGAWTIGHMRDVGDTLRDRFMGPYSERHLQGFAIVNFHAVSGSLRFGVEQFTIDRDKKGAPYVILGDMCFKG